MSLEFGMVFAFLAMVSWGVGDFLIQRTTRKIGDLQSLTFVGIIGSIGLFPLALNDLSLLFYPSNFLLLLFLGIVTFIIGYLDFEAVRVGKLSTIDVVIELELPITIIFALMFFKEALSFEQFFFISVIFIGIILIAIKSFARGKLRLERGVFIAVIVAIGMGVINFLTAASSKTISPIMAIWIPWVIYTIFCLVSLYIVKGFSKFTANAKKFKFLILVMGIIDTSAWLFYAFAVFKNELSIITAITESYPVIAVFLGTWFNKEKINWYQYLGAGMALVSSFALALSI